jgi:hypothetical protein
MKKIRIVNASFQLSTPFEVDEIMWILTAGGIDQSKIPTYKINYHKMHVGEEGGVILECDHPGFQKIALIQFYRGTDLSNTFCSYVVAKRDAWEEIDPNAEDIYKTWDKQMDSLSL